MHCHYANIVFALTRINILFHFVFICYVFVNFNAYSQKNQVTFESLITEFPEIDSRPERIYQDHQGYMWFGGINGLQQFDGYKIRTYSLEDLFEAHENVRAVDLLFDFLTDSKNNLWIVYGHGFFHFDSLTHQITRIYINNPYYKNSTLGMDLSCLYEDTKHNLWIGSTNDIIFKIPIDSIKGLLSNIRLEKNSISLPPSYIKTINISCNQDTLHDFNPIRKIIHDKTGEIWIGSDLYLVRLIPDLAGQNYTKSWYFEGFYNGDDNRYRALKNIFLDEYENLWVSQEGYLIHISYSKTADIDYNNEQIKFKNRYQKIYTTYTESLNERIFTLYPLESETGWTYYNKNHFWTSGGNNICHYIIEKGDSASYNVTKVNEYSKNEFDPNSWKIGARNIFISSDNVLWMNDRLHSVRKLDLHSADNFKRYYKLPGDPSSLPFNYVRTLHEDYTGRLWMTFIRKDSLFYLSDKDFSYFKAYAQSGNVHYTSFMQEDAFRNLWYVAYKNDLENKLEVIHLPTVYEKEDGHVHNYRYEKNHFNLDISDRGTSISGFVIDKNQVIWVAEKSGIYFSDLRKISSPYYENLRKIRFEQFINFDSLGIKILNWGGFKFLQSKRDTLYAVNSSKVLIIYPETKAIELLDFSIHSNDSTVMFIKLAMDKKGNIWGSDARHLQRISLAINSNGNHFIKEFKRYNEEDIFPINTYQIEIDSQDRIWFYADSKGIYVYDIEKDELKNFNGGNVLSGTVWAGMSYVDSRGLMYFQAIDGISVFNPEEVTYNPFNPEIKITGLKIHHGSISDLNNQKLNNKLRYKNILKVPYKDNNITIEFSAMQYSNPIRNQYKYYMTEMDKDTIYIDGKNPKAVYSYITPGEHEFVVLASNTNGKWSDAAAKLTIQVGYPWWATIYAYISYVLLFIGISLLWRYYNLKNIRLKHSIELKEVEAMKLIELDKLKSHFFTNISHEFRTPLTLILGPLENILSGNFKGDLINEAKIMSRNAKRLLGLINQILDLSKIDSKKMSLKATKNNFNDLILQVVANFESAALDKGISINTSIMNDAYLYFDIDLMEKVVENLISNALKNTSSGGQIDISLRTEEKKPSNVNNEDLDYIELVISDSGAGIPKEEINKIFDRFYKVNEKDKNKYQEGTGIGLSLVKEIINLHHGSIHVESEEGRGTCFYISLPLGKSHLSEEDIIMTSQEIIKNDSIHRYEYEDIEEESEDKEVVIPEDKYLLLIVEDNIDMRRYIRNIFGNAYGVIEARDGEEGIEKATDLVPDLIISDIMMPKMDGLELCNRLKDDRRTQHIPIIMLTAKADKESKIEGLDIGADDYITKPFDNQELLFKVKNQLSLMEKLRNKCIQGFLLGDKKDLIKSCNEVFLSDLIFVIMANIDNSEFKVEILSKEIGLSRSQLFRKLKALTGQNPQEFIRFIRIKKAAELLLKKTGNISDIAYAVGFDNPSYFSHCFTKVYKISPSEYADTRL